MGPCRVRRHKAPSLVLVLELRRAPGLSAAFIGVFGRSDRPQQWPKSAAIGSQIWWVKGLHPRETDFDCLPCASAVVGAADTAAVSLCLVVAAHVLGGLELLSYGCE